jgi:2-amino-4-hydroxy-6-hydroxymethyldihydropteridine diphosphokinase
MPPSSTERAATQACIGLGANLGDARAALDDAQRQLARLPHTTLIAASPLYRSAPIESSGPDYLNAVIVLHTSLSPASLLAALQRIEASHGRERPYRNAPRTLDLDLLLYGDRRIDTATLTVPHPRMHLRAFVLRPLLDVLPDAHIPGVGTAANRLADVADQPITKIAT